MNQKQVEKYRVLEFWCVNRTFFLRNRSFLIKSPQSLPQFWEWTSQHFLQFGWERLKFRSKIGMCVLRVIRDNFCALFRKKIVLKEQFRLSILPAKQPNFLKINPSGYLINVNLRNNLEVNSVQRQLSEPGWSLSASISSLAKVKLQWEDVAKKNVKCSKDTIKMFWQKYGSL